MTPKITMNDIPAKFKQDSEPNPKTVGELKALLAELPDNLPLSGFINEGGMWLHVVNNHANDRPELEINDDRTWTEKWTKRNK